MPSFCVSFSMIGDIRADSSPSPEIWIAEEQVLPRQATARHDRTESLHASRESPKPCLLKCEVRVDNAANRLDKP